MTQGHSLPTECVGEDAGRRSSEQGNQGPSTRRDSAANSRDPLSPVLKVPRMGPHGQMVPFPGIHFKPAWEELRECCPPQLATADPDNNKPFTFPN